jgi:hypothetical protein
VTDEVMRLVLDLASSSKDVGDLVQRLTELKAKSADVADTYHVMAQAGEGYTVTTRQESKALDEATAAAVRHTQAQKAINQVLEETAAAQTKASGTSREMQMRILNLGRAAQDLAQGGFGGIINNIEGIVGGGGLAAGVLTAIGTAALLATPAIKEWVKSLGAGAETFKPTFEGLEKYTEAIGKNKKAIAELKEKTSLTYDELLKYKDLVHETTKLEEDQANAREARQVQAGSSKKDRARAAAVKETIAERYGSGQELIDTVMATEHGQQIGQKRVEEIIAGAQKGFGHDIQSLQNVSPQFKERYAPFSPEAKEAYDKAQAGLKKEQAFQAEREKSIKEKETFDKSVRDAEAKDFANTARIDKDNEHKGLSEARRMSNEVQRKGQAQRDDAPDRAKKLQQVPHDANEHQAMMIMANNQIGLDAQIRADKQELLKLARQAQANINSTRTQASNGSP